MAFKADELTSQIFPREGPGEGGEAWYACPESTMKKPCANNTRPPCPDHTKPPGGPCPEDTVPPTGRKPVRDAGAPEGAGAGLALLQAHLRGRLAQPPAAGF